MTRRTRGREIALQVLYQVEQNPGHAPARRSAGSSSAGCSATASSASSPESLIAGVQEHQPRIDALISEVAENWRLDRMAAIDRNILRLGAYEMLFCPDVPTKVAINEALELAKRYSTGAVEPVRQRHPRPPPDGRRGRARRPRREAADRTRPSPRPRPTRRRRRRPLEA